jgi:hypothetical protein
VLEMRDSGDAAEKGDPFGFMSLDLGSINEEEDEVAVGIGCIVPRAYLMIEDPGWCTFYRDDGDVSLPRMDSCRYASVRSSVMGRWGAKLQGN